MPYQDAKHDRHQGQPINEVGRAAIVLPNDTSFYSTPLFIAVAFDAGTHGVTPEILGASRSTLPFLAAYEIFSRLCGDRAMRTVDGSLRVDGDVVTPERYLGLWRTGIGQASTPEQFAERHALCAYVELGGRFEGLRGQRASWSSSPFKTFDHFETAYRERIDYLDDNERFRVEFDLRQTHAARDAFYLESFLSYASQLEEFRPSIALKPFTPSHAPLTTMLPAQSNLFGVMEESL